MKKEKTFNLAAAFTIFIILCIVPLPVDGAEYPNRPITIISPASPGGLFDTVGRPFAMLAEKHLRQPLAVVNKPGATMMLGGKVVADAAPDVYTLLLGASAMACALEWEIAEGRKPPFTLLGDFVPIGSFVLTPPLVIVPYDSPWKTFNDLIRDTKAKPGGYAFCSGGLYGNTHVPVELLLRAIGTKARHVPYQGGGPCLSSVVGKHVDFGSQFPGSTIPLMRGKKLRVLAVQGNKRLQSIPDIPTVKELGVDAVFYNWLGLLAPKKTPAPIVAKLREVTAKVAREKPFIDAIEGQGDEVHTMTGDELAKHWARESETIARIYEQIKKEEKSSGK